MSMPPQKNKSNLALLALLISTFAIGTTEFIIMGILPQVSNDLNVSISATGLLVSGYAIGVAVGAPLLTILSVKVPRKKLLLGLMIFFVVGNGLCAIAPNYPFLLVARIIAAFSHGTFFGVGAVVASKLVPPEKKTQAVAMIFTGVSLANIVGVPLGTFIGQSLGWRFSFGIVCLLGTISVFGIALLVPKISNSDAPNFSKEMTVLKDPQVLLTLLMTILSFVGVFATFTFIAPILTEITGFSESMLTPILLLYGVGLTIGNTVAARLSDWKPMPTLVAMLLLLSIVMGAFSITSHNQMAAVITIFIWGFASFGHVPGFQTRVIEKAKAAPNLASSLNISAFNSGIAIGAYLGGVIIDSGLGLGAVPLFASIFTIVCLLVTIWGWILDSRIKPAALESRMN